MSYFPDQLQAEIDQVDRAVDEMEEVRARLRVAGDDRIVIHSAAAQLHHFYTGVEKILTHIARKFEGLPKSPEWHRDLLDAMVREIPAVRPAALTTSTVERLKPYRAFRHRFRNLYLFDLDLNQLWPLLDGASATWTVIKSELRSFLESLVSESR